MAFNHKLLTDMYLVTKYRGLAAQNQAKTPTHLWGMGLDDKLIERVETVEVWGTKFSHDGPHYTHQIARDSEGVVLSQHIVEGY